jgi:hypothetical protein
VWSTGTGTEYRDIYQAANGRSHVHFFEPYTTTGTSLVSPATRITSPFAQNP